MPHNCGRNAIMPWLLENDIRDWSTIKQRVRDEVSHVVYDKTKRSPMILPIIMEV